MEKNLVIDYMNQNKISLAQANHELRRVGNSCTSATELLQKIDFDIDYVIQAMDFVPCYKAY